MSRFPSPLRALRLSSMLLIGTGAIGISAAPAVAQTAAEHRFDIRAQPLVDAMREFSKVAGVQVAYTASIGNGVTSRGVSGTFSSAEALSRLLTGTGLSFRFTGPNAVTLDAAPKSAEDAIQLGPVRVEGEHRAASSLSPSADPVITELQRGYAAVATNVGKAPLNQREIPQSVTVITRELIEDQALFGIENVMMQMTGVTIDRNWRASEYSSRGLTITNVRIDGGATGGRTDGTTQIDTAIYDSVALIRGADGLFGGGEAGGVITLTRKRALENTQLQIAAFGGSWNNYRLEVDATGALTGDGSIRARAIGLIDNGDSFQRFKEDRRRLIHGVIEADLTPNTLVVAGFTHQWDRIDGFNVSLPRYRNGDDIGLPRSFNMGSPTDFIERRTNIAFGRLEQKVGPNWLVKLTGQYLRYRDLADAREMEGPLDPISMQGGITQYFQHDNGLKQTLLDLNVQGSIHAFGQQHDLIIGADYVDEEHNFQGNFMYAGEIDILNPVYIPRLPYPSFDLFDGQAYPYDVYGKRIGLYGSLRIRPIAALSIIGGGRLNVKDDTRSFDPLTDFMFSRVNEKNVFIPYVGFVFDVDSRFSLYGSVTEIYQSQADQRSGPRPGTPLAPIRGRNHEVGIKGEFANGRLLGSIAYYNLNKKGEAISDPAYPEIPDDPCCFIRDGRLKSEGFEVELNGELLPGWNLSFGYTFNNNSNSRASDVRFSEITPKHLLKIWTQYNIAQGGLEGLSVGIGVTAQSRGFRTDYGRLFNPDTGLYDGEYFEYKFYTPKRSVWSARLGYDIDDRYSVSVNLNNIFDKKYYTTIGYAGWGNFYGDPRNFLVSLRGKF